jgi:hypothetical protein
MQEKIGKNLTRFLIFSLFLGIIGYCFKIKKNKNEKIYDYIILFTVRLMTLSG